MTVKHWNTGAAAMRFRHNLKLKNKKKKKKAPSSKLQAPSSKLQASSATKRTQLKSIINLERNKL